MSPSSASFAIIPRTSIGSDGEGLREYIWLVNVGRTSEKYAEEELRIYRWNVDIAAQSICRDAWMTKIS
jgi:hypothetical protein